VNNNYDLTEEELIDDTLTRAFVMLLGTKMPDTIVMEHMLSWVKVQNSKTNETLTEDFILNQIPNYINYLFKR
jgi:hypothetical protein